MAGTADAVAELYALMPDAFTAARNQRASDAAKAGDKPSGKAIRALPKPSSAAWLVNMLTLHRPELIAEVLELGAVLREAQNDLDQKQLRQLSGERQRLLRSAAREARSLAAELGHPVSTAVAAEVEQTLWAAMTDADAASAASSGQLVRALEANGWDPVDVDGAVADPGSVHPLASGQRQRPRPDTSSGTDAGGHASRAGASEDDAGSAAAARKEKAAAARALRTARTVLQEAQRDAEQAEDTLKSAQQEIDDLADRRDELTDEIDELRERIRDLERLVSAVDRRAGTLERERDAARRSARAARRAVEKAQANLESLG